MKEIQLTQGKVALVDNEDYDYLMQWKWFAHNQCGKFYARTNIPNKNGKRGSMLMHRLILNILNSKLQIDHLNHITLDNRKCNLRVCTQSENLQNCNIYNNNTSGYKGVTYNKTNKKWQASISVNKDRLYIGSFNNIKDAARAYNAAAIKLHGEFAKLNEI